MRKLGLVAGGGELPVRLASHCRSISRPLFIVRVQGACEPELASQDGVDLAIGQFGRAVQALKAAGCASVCLAGTVGRPDFSALSVDAQGLRLLPGAVAAATRGDDALLKYLVGAFERAGLPVEGADAVMGELLLGRGPLGRRRPGRLDRRDIQRAVSAARAIGALDIGQAAIACRGLVLALEAQEGTDAMLARVAALPAELRGSPQARRGVLVKICKPAQERRIDLPTIGPATVDLAGEAGLAGIAGEAGGALVVDRAEVARRADFLGLFVVGL